ncbi:MAG TPA: septation protein SepH, partial [Trebonia sp.]
MQELRFVAVSEDGSYAVLAVPGRSGRYILPIDERLRAVALGQTSRLAQYEIEVESPLRPKEIQARIRAGETAEEIADAAGIPVERVRWFEGPVLAERAYIADQAQAGSVRRAGGSSGPGPRLGDIVTARLSAADTDPADGQWDSRKRGDGNWQVSLTFPSGGRLHVAEWVFDPRRRHVMPDDDNAARLSLPESELPAEPVPVPGEATVTPIAPRLGAAAGMGGGSVGGHPGGPGMSRFRPERSVIPDRSLGLDRSLVERPAPPAVPAAERTAMADRSAVSDRSSVSDRFAATERPAPSTSGPPRSAQQDRAGYQGRPANPGYAEFPESAPYRA